MVNRPFGSTFIYDWPVQLHQGLIEYPAPTLATNIRRKLVSCGWPMSRPSQSVAAMHERCPAPPCRQVVMELLLFFREQNVFFFKSSNKEDLIYI